MAESGMVKAGIIDILVDSFGWVVGKALLFALAVVAGFGMGVIALAAGTAAGGGGFGFASINPGIHTHLVVVASLLPLVACVFWAGMWFVRSENAGAREWGVIAGIHTILLVACFTAALPSGWLSKAAAWGLALAMPLMLGTGLWVFQQWRMSRWTRKT